MRRMLPVLFVVMLTAACSSKNSPSPAAPSDTPSGSSSSPAPAPSPSNTVTGRIVSNPGGNGVAGATIDMQGTTITTDGNGNFSVQASNQDRKVTVSASGFLGRETWLHSGSRTNISIDLIANTEPFSLDFYRTIARGAGSTSLQPLRRWDENPNFYIKTTDQAGQPLPQSAIDTVENTIRQSLPGITNGHLGAGRVERGATARSMTSGWINVELTTDMNYNFCGEALVGANPGHILLNATTRNKCGQVVPSPGCIGHELGHSMGLWHTQPPTRMQPVPDASGPPCESGELTPKEKYHTALLYSRPRDNMDTDIDPGSFQLLTPHSAEAETSLNCPLR